MVMTSYLYWKFDTYVADFCVVAMFLLFACAVSRRLLLGWFDALSMIANTFGQYTNRRDVDAKLCAA